MTSFAFPQTLEEMAATKRHIAVVAADLGLRADRDRMTFGIDAQIHGRLAPAIADGLKLDQGIGER